MAAMPNRPPLAVETQSPPRVTEARTETPQPSAPTNKTEGFLGRLAARAELATQRQHEKLIEERIKGNMALERSGMKLLTAEYDMAAEKAERFNRMQTSCAAHARRLCERGGLFNNILGWANRTLASFFGWRARSAARTRDYYLEDLAGN